MVWRTPTYSNDDILSTHINQLPTRLNNAGTECLDSTGTRYTVLYYGLGKEKQCYVRFMHPDKFLDFFPFLVFDTWVPGSKHC